MTTAASRSVWPVAICTAACLLPASVPAQEAGEVEDAERYARQLEAGAGRLRLLQQQLDEQERALAGSRRELMQQRRELEALRLHLRGRGGAPGTESAAAAMATDGAGAAAAPVGEAPPVSDRLPQTAQIFAEPTVLTPPGALTLEPSLQYVHASNNRVALVGFTVIPAITIGLIDVRRVTRDAYYAALTTRYGLANRLEVEAKVPYVYSSTSTLTRPLATPSVADTQFDATGKGIGDVELAARYQLNQFRGDNLVYVGSLRLRLPTGTGPFEVGYDPATNLQTELPTGSGFYGLQGGLSFLYPSDPVVFFSGANYQHNFERDVGNGFGRIRPGNVVDINFGMGLALNEKASFSFGYQHSVVHGMTQIGPAAAGKTLSPTSTTQLGTARFGLTYAVTPKTAINLSLGIGVTRETPDLELTLRLPMRI